MISITPFIGKIIYIYFFLVGLIVCITSQVTTLKRQVPLTTLPKWPHGCWFTTLDRTVISQQLLAGLSGKIHADIPSWTTHFNDWQTHTDTRTYYHKERNKMFILPSVFFSLHINNTCQQSPLGGKRPQNTTNTTKCFHWVHPVTFWNQCSDKIKKGNQNSIRFTKKVRKKTKVTCVTDEWVPLVTTWSPKTFSK